MIGLGLSTTQVACRQRRAGPTLDYTPVVIFMGDSQAYGNTESGGQAALVAAYGTPSDKIKVRNAAGQWVTYTPGTITGLQAGANIGQVGSEMEFALRWRAAYPNDTLYLIKDTASGAFQGRGVSTGTFTASCASGNIMTVTSAAGTYPPSNSVLTGSGLPASTYTPFSVGGQPGNFYLTTVGTAGYSGGTWGSTTVTRYNGTLSWSPASGLTYNGHSNSASNGARARWVSALASLANPRIIGMAHILGTNDFANAGTGAAFADELAAFWTRIAGDMDFSHAAIVMPRIWSASNGVRAAQAAFKDAQAQWFMANTDDLTRHDGTHWNAAGLVSLGDRIFDVMVNGGAGVTGA